MHCGWYLYCHILIALKLEEEKVLLLQYLCVTVCNQGVRGDQVYTECLGIDKVDAYVGRKGKANTAPVNTIAFERRRNKAGFYLAWGNAQKEPAMQRGEF